MWTATQYIIDVCLVAALTMATNRHTSLSLSPLLFLFHPIINDLATEHIYMQHSV
jgi:hypothetical protein